MDDITKKNGVLDQYAAEIESSWVSNHERWKNESFATIIPFDEGIDELRSGLDARSETIDQVVESAIGKVYVTITFMDGDKVIKTCQARIGSQINSEDIPDDPVKDGYFFLNWMEEGGSVASPYTTFKEDETIYANFIPDADVIRPETIFFEQHEQWASLAAASKRLYYEIVPADVQDERLIWTSSDPSVAEVTSNGRARMLSTGDTTITCTAANGVSSSIVLHVYDPEETPEQIAKSLQLEADLPALVPGEYGQVIGTISPQPAKFSIEYESSDRGVATVDDYGVVWAIAPGTCEITATDSRSGLVASCTVTVIDPAAIAEAKDGLAGKIVEAIGVMGAGSYTQDSFAALQQAIAAANGAIDDDHATLEAIAAARTELLRALRQLEPVNRAALDEAAARSKAIDNLTLTLVDMYENVKLGKFTAKSATAFKAALAAADDVLASASSTSAELRQARTSVLLARKALVKKSANTLACNGKTVKVKAKTLKKKKVVVQKAKAFKISNAKGKVSFAKVSGNAKIAVSNAGVVTVKKGLKPGTYKVKVKVTAAGNGNYLKVAKTVTFTVKIEK